MNTDPTQSPHKSCSDYRNTDTSQSRIVRVSVKSAWSPAPKRGHVYRTRPPPAVENENGRLDLDFKEADGREVAHKQALIFTSPRESEEHCEPKNSYGTFFKWKVSQKSLKPTNIRDRKKVFFSTIRIRISRAEVRTKAEVEGFVF
jgi:hypothetical protein